MINHGYAQAMAHKKSLRLPGGVIFHDDQLLNEGVNTEGVGVNRTILAPYATFPAGVAQMRVRPRSGHYLDNLALAHFMLWGDFEQTRRGLHGLEILTDLPSNMTGLSVRHVYARGSVETSVRLANHPANFQGCPANAAFELCQFWEGIDATYHGDNLSILQTVLRSTGARQGLRFYATDTQGIAGNLTVERCNFDCEGGAAIVLRGRNVRFLNNNAEQTCGAGPNGAVFDLDGSSGVISGWSQFIGNHVAVFGTATPTAAIRVNGVDGLKIDDYDLLSALDTQYGVDVTAAAQNIVLGHGKILGFQSALNDPHGRVTQVNAV